ncbi:MAG: bifunctional nuclease family protein [Candidatus Omnitrophica bacterium]|nr:bifunctional nuclease family protein [Candidatus Omnitrophota bacterium]
MIMVELVLSKIKVDENRSEQVIVLKEKSGKRMLPVIIGLPEVSAIKLKLSGVKTPRPMTHDLLLNAIGSLGATVKRIVIDHLENNTFYAKLVLSQDSREILVDARPSDSVALALGANVPIYADEKVLDEAGIPLE